MAERELNNPSGGNSMSTVVADHRLFVGGDGHAVALSREIIEIQASGAVAVGDLVSLVPPSAADTPLRVKQAVTGDQAHLKIGVAIRAATATGQIIQVVVAGFVFAKVGSGTPAAGNWGSPSATAGEVAVNTAAADATTISGTQLGTFLAAKNASNLAPMWFHRN